MSMGRRRRVRADEHDTASRMRRYLCYLAHPGVTHAIKTRMLRRERRAAKEAIRTGAYI